MKLTLSIMEVDQAYNAVNENTSLAHTAPDLLQMLDVESLQDDYEFDLTTAQFEHIRLSVKHHLGCEELAERMLEIRATIL